MSYGLYDADIPYYITPFYNLELMKLSSYYKHKREIVGLAPDFSPGRYSNFIVRQDFYNPATIFYKGVNVTYGGRAFNGNIYKPLPIEIESCQPDISLYNNFRSLVLKKDAYKTARSTMNRAEHIRLSLDGKTIWKDYEKQLRHNSNAFGVIFHDYNLNDIDGAVEFISIMLPEWIHHPQGRRIGMKFPVQVDNIDDLSNWLKIQPMGLYYSVQHNGLIDESYIPILKELQLTYAIMGQVSVNIANIFTEDELINGGMRRLFRNIINLRSHKLVFPLIYNENFYINNSWTSLLINEDWKKVMELIRRYNEHLVSGKNSDFFQRVEPYETLFSYCAAAIKQYQIKDSFFSKENLEPIFQFVRENDYELFKDFYEYRGGEVRNDR